MQSIINKLISSIKKKKVTDNSLFKRYIEIFYAESSVSDLESYSSDSLLKLCLSSFNLFSKKSKDEFKVRVYNPTVEKDGFESDFTILDVVNNDAPFLVDSIIMHFDKMGIEVKNIIHPIFTTKRTSGGTLKDIPVSNEGDHESVIQLHLTQISSQKELKEVENSLKKILETVHLVVNDWKNIVAVANKSGEELSRVKNSKLDVQEVKEFINWICNDSFIFLGSCEYDLVKKDGKAILKEIPKSNLGIFRSKHDEIKPNSADYSSGDIKDLVKNPYLVEILKSRYKSQIHRNVNAERIRVQKFDDKGNVIGEYRFIGLFTSSVYYQSANLIPIIRKKIAKIIEEVNFKPHGHNSKDLYSILESYPRDELFQIEYDDLLRISLGVVAMSGRPLVRYFARYDKFERFVSALIFIPRDNFNTYVKEEIHKLLESQYQGELLGSYIQVTESNLTRLHIIIRTDNGIPKVNYNEIEEKVEDISRSWVDDFRNEANRIYDRKAAKNIITNYQNAFSVSYMHRFKAGNAIHDVDFINKAINYEKVLGFDLYQSSSADENVAEIKIYNLEKKLQLSDMMPVLDSFGFNVIHEHTYLVSPKDSKDVWVHYFNINLSKFGDKLTDEIINNFEDTISKIYEGKTQIGHLNRMVVAANLNNRQISLLRAYSKYLYQAGFRYSQKYISNTLVKHRDITKLIIELFEAKFNPANARGNQSAIAKISDQINKNIAKVTDSTDDMILQKFVNIVESTIRTNFFQLNDKREFKDYISFKFDCSKIQDLVLPVPYAEIFVFSNDIEGVHLRGGKVARGGLRWSDRHEDFRTEVLGLMKAQMTKNAVIVPVGSKGGFVVKADTSLMDREEATQTAIKCYKTFLRGILDITDNVIDGKIIYPNNVVRYDEADPYLVVAADKGTATFSDIANEISSEYNFWLGDAFASGGSVGYDHKKMGITAKGAWISVKRHFSEMGIDTQTQEFSCVGVGDLSGDVFGNGMLLSKHIKLNAAFNHLHIFLDPNPDVGASYKERQRMFNLPRSSWTDYNTKLISKGGGIFDRSAKSIKISKEMRKVLDIEESQLAPDELITAILKSPVDLLWNGGIGTYVKAASESHMDVGDRVNDSVRINGSELRCKVVGEGGNLGLTQQGRIEYAAAGGRINTDAMDNSAGVDCSDHEVNIKIALTQAMKAGKISLKQRNKILESMTDAVEEMVLDDNLLQTQTITISQSKGPMALGDHSRFLTRLEKIGLLNREVEFLPSQKQIEKKQSDKVGMTRPELCVMLSYAKMDLYNNIINSSLVKDKFFEGMLLNYFPDILQKDFKDEILTHQLRDEIIATQITNMAVGRLGISFVSQVARDNGFKIVDIARNIIIVSESFGLEDIWAEIESLDNKKVPVEIQVRMFTAVNKLLERSVLWLLRNVKSKDIAATSQKFKTIINKLSGNLDSLLAAASREAYDKNFAAYQKCGVSNSLSKKIAAMDPLASAYDIIDISEKTNVNLENISQIYFQVGTRLHLKWLRTKIVGSNVNNYWQRISTKTILEDLYHYQMRIAKGVVNYSCKGKKSCMSQEALENWINSEDFLIERYDRFISDFKSQVNPDLSMFIVALNRIKALTSKI